MAMKTKVMVEAVVARVIVNLDYNQWRSQCPFSHVQGTYSSFLVHGYAALFIQVFAPCP